MDGSDDEKRKEADARRARDAGRRLLELVGAFAWDPAYDYKAERSRARVEAVDADSQLSDEQLAELRERAENPGPIASPERVAEVLAKFRVK